VVVVKRRLRLLAVLLLALAASPARLTTAQETRADGGVGITVYEDPNYGGRSASFRDEVPDLRRFDLNDKISSFSIARGETWEVCVDIDYGGRCQVVTGAEPDLRRRSGWHDTISSMHRIRGGSRRGGGGGISGGTEAVLPGAAGRPQISLYDRTGFRGSSRVVDSPMSSLGSFGPRVRSVRIMTGRWELCEGTRWSDRCVVVQDSITDIGRSGLRGVSSVRPR
jgi:Beta/Gamma crystallin